METTARKTETKYLKISNKGVVVPQAFSLVGASTKRNETDKIGMFGSGNKYAISYLFRNGYDFKVFSGGREMVFSTEPSEFSGQRFDVITINGKETSLTTQMGPKWSLWQVVRELYSNAIDEGLIGIEMVDDMSEDSQDTHVYIPTDNALTEIFDNINDYFAMDKEVVFECPEGKIYKKHSSKTCIYRKGIKCYETEQPSIFDYDFNDVNITEDRVLKYSWDVENIMWSILEKCDNPKVIYKILTEISDSKYIENRIDSGMVGFDGDDFNEQWKNVLSDYKICPRNMGGYLKDSERSTTLLIPAKLYRCLVSNFGNDMKTQSFTVASNGNPFTLIEPNDFQKKIIKEILDFFKESGLDIPYDIRVADFNKKTIHGGVSDETILIGLNSFETGKTWVANVIIEEYIHIKYDAADETRSFQDAIIGEFLTSMQKRNAYIL